MKGFTLIELLIVVVIIMMIGALSVPFFQSFAVSSELYTLTDEVTRILRLTQSMSIAGQNDSAWGIYFDEGNKKYVLYQGTSYATRNPSEDLEINYKTIFAASNDFTDDINFIQYSGIPSYPASAATQGVITLTSQNNQVNQITINQLGLIDANF